jgi:hypothetical protein
LASLPDGESEVMIRRLRWVVLLWLARQGWEFVQRRRAARATR